MSGSGGIIASEQRELCAVIDSKSHAQTGTSPPELCVEWTTSGVYECQWKNCNQNFATVDGLVMHINSEHVHIERPDVDYRCQWRGCVRQGKGFNARYKMLIHLRTHTQERPHKCPICYKCFSRVENLKIHNRSHTGERPYPCPFEGCSKAYSNSSDRFKHIKTHREQRPFICKHPGCIKRYTDPSSLRKHVRIHGHYFHNEDMAAKGPICQSGVSSSHDQIDCNNSNSNTSNISVDNCLSSSDTDLVTTPRPMGTGSNEIATRLLPCSSALATVIIPLSSASTPTSIEFSPGTTAIFTVPQRILHFPGQGSVSCFEYSAVSCDTVSSHISGCDVEGIGILPSTHNLPVELSTATQCRSTQTEVLTGVSGGTGTILSCLPTSDLALRSEAMLPTPTLGDDEVSPENIIHVQTSSESPETVNSNEQHPLDLSTSPISHHPLISLANLHADEIDSSGDNSLSSSLGENGKWELPNLNPD